MKIDKMKPDDEMRPEYDFSKAERGKFYRPLIKNQNYLQILTTAYFQIHLRLFAMVDWSAMSKFSWRWVTIY